MIPNKRSKRNQTKIDNEIADLVDNPIAISSYKSTAKSLITTTSVSEAAYLVPTLYFEYVIITTNTCKPYFNDFVNWKRKKGYDIGVVTVDEIYSNYPNGDLISGIDDEAGSIRQYLNDSYEDGGTMFALLAGDANTVPVRYGCALEGPPLLGDEVPSDLYFADFTGNWNTDGDIYYGERTQDNIDYYNEIYVSRLLCNNSDAANITNWVKKY